MVEQTVNDIIEHLNSQADIFLPDLDAGAEPVASNLEELVGVLGATEIDPASFESFGEEGDEPEARDPLEVMSEEESPNRLEAESGEESPDPLEDDPAPIEIEQKKDE